MELIELPKDKLTLGMSLKCTLRDESGAILLAKGNRIDTKQQLEGIKSRRQIFIEIDESEDAVKIMMNGLVALDRAGAAIKDYSKYINLKKEPEEEKLVGTLVQRWSDVESKLAGLLASVNETSNFDQKVRKLAEFVDLLMKEDATAAQFLLFNRSVSHFTGYSVLHSLLCASLCHSLCGLFKLTPAEQTSLVCAAMTMNIAMTALQDELALQKSPPSPGQRSTIDQHAVAGRQLLVKAGVTDPLWLDVVALHHHPLDNPGSLTEWAPVQRMAKILQTVDRYTAAMSPRKSRSGRTARDSVKSVVVQAGSTKHDEVGTALVGLLGLSPPGTYVKLGNGETAVVMRRGARPAEPLVASVLNRNDEPVAEPRLRDVAREQIAIQATLTATDIRVNLKLEAMLKIMPKH